MMQAVSGNELARLEGYPFEARYSEGARAEAVRLAELAKEGYDARGEEKINPGWATGRNKFGRPRT